MTAKKLPLFALFAAVVVVPTVASAAAPAGNGLGKAGQIAIRSDLDLNFHSTSTKPANGDSKSTTTFRLGPAADYFVADNISIGALLSFAKLGEDIHQIRLAPRVGYHLSMGDQLSLWPTAGIYWQNTSFKSSVTVAGSTTTIDGSSSQLGLVLDVPILFHPASNFFLGLGPRITMDLTSTQKSGDVSADGSKTTDIGVVTTIGGYF